MRVNGNYIFVNYGNAQVRELACPFFWSVFSKKSSNVYIQEWNFNTIDNVRMYSITFCAQEVSQLVFGDIGLNPSKIRKKYSNWDTLTPRQVSNCDGVVLETLDHKFQWPQED